MKLTIGKAAKELGVSINTLRRWDKEGILVPDKTPSGHRRYDENKIKEFYKKKDE
jgi:putative resolvase